MGAHKYWTALFTPETWTEFLQAGCTFVGYRERRWNHLAKVNPGDQIICYVTRVSRLAGIVKVTGTRSKDNSVIWRGELFPARLPVRPIVVLQLDAAVPIIALKDKLSFFSNMDQPYEWKGHVRTAPMLWKTTDGDAILDALIRVKEQLPTQA